MNRTKKAWAPFVSLMALAASSTAMAGAQTESAYCYKAADGSGYCAGNFMGFRSHSGANTYARFNQVNSTSRTFLGSYTTASGTVTGSCVPDAAMAARWTKAMSHQGYFAIYWNTAGTCYQLYLYNGSQYASF
ncbi:hypothetical protein [Myxococcus sp. AB025B]|uniref:hypothetical protein n=1 Tax=Myxococcus TaxID=32 RepID=UPI001142817B|nr:hypothetical protein [Myxococcus sp. AB025B]